MNRLIFHIVLTIFLVARGGKASSQEPKFYHYQNPKKNKIKSVKILVSNSHSEASKILGFYQYNKKGLLTDSTDQQGNECRYTYGKKNELLAIENRIFEVTTSGNEALYHLKKSFKTTNQYHNNKKIVSKHFESDTLIQIIEYSYKDKLISKYINKNRQASLLGMGYYEHDTKGRVILEEYFNASSKKQFQIAYQYNKKGNLTLRKEQWYNPDQTNTWSQIEENNKVIINDISTIVIDSTNPSNTTHKYVEVELNKSKKKIREIHQWFNQEKTDTSTPLLEQIFTFDKTGKCLRTEIKQPSSDLSIEGTYLYHPNKLIDNISFENKTTNEPEFTINYQYEFY